MDEKALAKGHRCTTIVSDLRQSTVEYVGEERTEALPAIDYAAFTKAPRASIEAVAMET